jgi:hypothetical protein
MRVDIKKDTTTKKKYVATFYEGTKRIKTTRFGADGYVDYTRGATDKQRDAYRKRHAGDNLTDKYSAGALSYYVLWSAKTLKQGVANYKRRFNLT